MEDKTTINTDFYYDAFISYRRVEPDQTIAKLVHKQLESFKLPKNVIKKIKAENPSAKTKITRVFRDQEELPLTSNLGDQLKQALEQSKWLIVICSPSFLESEWCKTEIEYFTALRGPEYVLTVLADGRSSEAIPEIFRKDSQMLAANYRKMPDTNWKKHIKTEFLRLVAPMFELTFDELKQRHREQLMKKRLYSAIAIGATGLCLGIVASLIALKLDQKNTELLKDQALFLAKQSNEYLENQDRENAILTAYQALTSYEGSKMPYTSEAMFSLTQSIDPNSSYAGRFLANAQVTVDGIIYDVQISPSGKTVMLVDDTDTLTFVSTDTYKILGQTDIKSPVGYESDYSSNHILYDDNTLLYINDNLVIEYDITAGTETEKPYYESSGKVVAISHDASYEKLVIVEEQNLTIYDYTSRDCIYSGTAKEIADIEIEDDEYYELVHAFYNSENKLIIEGYCDSFGVFIIIWDYLVPNKEPYFLSYDNRDLAAIEESPTSVLDVLTYDDNYYILFNTYSMDQDVAKYDITLACYSTSQKDYLWKKVSTNSVLNFYSDSRLSIYSDEYNTDTLIFIGDYMLGEYDLSTGETISTVYYDRLIETLTSPYGCSLYTASNKQYIYCMRNLQPNVRFSSYVFDNELLLTKWVFKDYDTRYRINIPMGSNQCIFYTYGLREKKEIETPCTVDSRALYDEEAVAEAKKLDIPNATLTDVIVYDTDEKKICVTYRTGTASVYNIDETDKALYSWDLGFGTYINTYCGQDKEENTYWASYNSFNQDIYGYRFSQDNVMTGVFADLISIDNENNVLNIYINDGYYSCPIYSLDDLLKMAEEYMDAHNLM